MSLKMEAASLSEIKAMVVRHEGKVNKCYADSLGKLTFGIGHLVTKDDNIDPDKEYSDDFVYKLFDKDNPPPLQLGKVLPRIIGDTVDRARRIIPQRE